MCCTRKCWLVGLTVLLGIAMLGAFVSPWYIMGGAFKITEGHTAAAVVIFYWRGAFLYTDNGFSDNNNEHLEYSYFEGHKMSQVYIACNVLGIVAFVMTLAAPFALYFLLFNENGWSHSSFTCRKALICIYYGLIAVLVILAWTVFFAWTPAINKSTLCTSPLATWGGNNHCPHHFLCVLLFQLATRTKTLKIIIKLIIFAFLFFKKVSSRVHPCLELSLSP